MQPVNQRRKELPLTELHDNTDPGFYFYLKGNGHAIGKVPFKGQWQYDVGKKFVFHYACKIPKKFSDLNKQGKSFTA